MRNQFCKTIKCELRHTLYSEELSLQVIYANEVSIYDLQRCMNYLNIICLLAVIILNTNKIQEKICAEILYMRDCRLDFSKILNGV